MIRSLTLFGDLPHERELLRVRLAEELPYIDSFEVCESDRTHAGKRKPYGILEMPDVLANPKVTYRQHTAKVYPNKHRVKYNIDQLNALAVNIKDDDVIICSDLDEVNDRRDMPRIIAAIRDQGYVHLSLYNHQYYLNYKGNHQLAYWTLSYGCTGKYFKTAGLTFYALRCEWCPGSVYRHPFEFLSTTGHHFSYILTPQQIVDKLSNTSDACFDTPDRKDVVWLKQAIENGLDVLKRYDLKQVWTAEPLDDRWPASVLNNMTYWQPWVKPVGV